MSIDEIHEMANKINENWTSLLPDKQRFVHDSDFYNMLESAYLMAKASE